MKIKEINQINKRNDRTMHIAEAFYTNNIVSPLLPYVSKTKITPNMITTINIILSFYILFLAYEGEYVFVAIGIQIYLFLDIFDGNLARYKNMRSEFGSKLDRISDGIFYNLIFFCIAHNNVKWYIAILPIILNIMYGKIATNIIVPRLKRIKKIKRFGLKKFFLKKGYIIGMDIGTVDIIITVTLILNKIKVMYIIIIIGYIIDIIYRFVELKVNERRIN